MSHWRFVEVRSVRLLKQVALATGDNEPISANWRPTSSNSRGVGGSCADLRLSLDVAIRGALSKMISVPSCPARLDIENKLVGIPGCCSRSVWHFIANLPATAS
ncbi:MAG: hypothetical protein ACLR4Z_19035 [Butyricicoccaceae bacterium]